MRLATIKWNDTEMAGIVAKNGILPHPLPERG